MKDNFIMEKSMEKVSININQKFDMKDNIRMD